MRKKYLITFSGGKDSLAIIIWAKNTLAWDDWEVVFCDTGWESPITYEYINFIEKHIGKKIIRLKTEAFASKIDQHILDSVIRIFGERNVFAEMVLAKGRFPSTRARFCTEELKMKVMIDYILTLESDIVVVQGVRSEESAARMMLKKNDEYFRFYFEPRGKNKKGKPIYDSYRKKDLVKWLDLYTCDVQRPIIALTALEVFDIIFSAGLKPNPLYFKGHSRVGCYPCIMSQLAEIKLIAENDPHRIEQLEQLEQLAGSTFFPPGYIPLKYCSKKCSVRVYPEALSKLFGGKLKQKERNGDVLFEAEVKDPNAALYDMYFKNPGIKVHTDEDGDEYIIRRMKVPTIRDVVNYVCTPGQQLLEVSQPGCVSFYNICEVNK